MSEKSETLVRKPRRSSPVNYFRAIAVGIVVFYSLAIYQFGMTVYRAVYFGKWEFSFLALWILLDIACVLYMRIRFETLMPDTSHLPSATSDEQVDICREMINPKSCPDARVFFETWFKNIPFEQVGKFNLMKWIAEIGFNRKIHTMTPEQLNDCVVFMALFEEYFKIKLEDQPEASMYSLTQDRLRMVYRPFIFYAATTAISWGNRYFLYSNGFTRKDYGPMVAFYRVGKSTELPLVFFHGMGVGLAPYSNFLKAMMKRFPDRTLIFFEFPMISMRAEYHSALPPECADIIYQVCKELNITKIYAIAHSFGTISICWLDKFYPGLIAERIFIDPICFALWTIHTMRNFLYREPLSFKHYIFVYVCAREPGVQLYLRRYFVWNYNTYFSSDLPENSTIYIPERDDIVDAKYLESYLGNFPSKTREVVVMPRHKHMQKLLSGKFGDILDKIEEKSKKIQ